MVLIQKWSACHADRFGGGYVMSSQIHVLLVALSMVGSALGVGPFQAATSPADRIGGGAAGGDAVYGDITSAAGLCIPDGNCLAGDVDFDDVLCALNGFALPADCPCADINNPNCIGPAP